MTIEHLKEKINERITREQLPHMPKFQPYRGEEPRKTGAQLALEWVLRELEGVGK